MTKSQHRAQHQELHRSLDELLADFIRHTGRLLTKTSVMELMEWSHQQTIEPTADGESPPPASPDPAGRPS